VGVLLQNVEEQIIAPTVWDDVSYSPRSYGHGEAEVEKRVTAALEKVGIAHLRHKVCHHLSGGEKRKVALAGALVLDPELLVLDEPLSGMDPLMRRRTIRLIRQWADGGKSVIVSSHVLHEIEAMTATIVLMHNGRIVAEGDVHQIRALIDAHPHRVSIRAADPRSLAKRLLVDDDVSSFRFEGDALLVETANPDSFYSRLTEVAASGDAGSIEEVTSPDDNLQAVFSYLVKP
jgi:ABC-2 type transport system ATP-binding protein